jgi:hypothetical protein
MGRSSGATSALREHMRKIFFGAAVIVTGCMPVDPISQHATNNPNVNVELLFSHEGCDVFRFRDPAYHYYVRCSGVGVQAQTTQQVSCGKNCSREEAIQTISAPAPLNTP